ncbi:MAG TPA: hypothetical protein VFR18_01195, partial [Terriglobia bacterium]|nr:hypothetical protein [Terriglobia bacterium]
MTLAKWIIGCAVCCLFLGWVASAGVPNTSMVTGNISMIRANGSPRTDNDTGIVVWLTPVPRRPATPSRTPSVRPKIVQKNKRFQTRLLAVEVGTVVDFPNEDPFFHNVFSRLNGKQFDLLLYEAGANRAVTFDKPGICYIFCNIHSKMSSVVVV